MLLNFPKKIEKNNKKRKYIKRVEEGKQGYVQRKEQQKA